MPIDPRPCCILGVCCPPGGAEQRAELKAWLDAKLAEIGHAEKAEDGTVDRWLDELQAEPKG